MGTTVPLATAVLTVIDVETTGLEPEDRITEVAGLRLQGSRELARFQSLVNPGTHIPPLATRISGIDDAMVSGAPAFPGVWPTLENLLEGAVFVAHNAPFDMHFLSSERKRAGFDSWKGPVLDTLRLARNTVELPGYSLAALGRALKLEHEPAHRAMADVLATTALLRELIKRLGPRVRTIDDLLEAQKPISIPWEKAQSSGLSEELLGPLVDAAIKGEAIRIQYEGRSGMRQFRIRPVRLEHNGPLYYLQAAMVLKEDEPGTFRCDRIRGVEPAE